MKSASDDKGKESYKRDIEESDELLESNEGDSLEFWEKKQRELVTSVVDYNLQGLTDLVTDKAIDLNPAYQRRLRWDDVRQSKLIESFLMNVPVPPVFLNEDEYGAYSVIDGKQRITAISSFMKGSLRLKGLNVFHELNGLNFDKLPALLQRAIRTRPTLRAVIILRQSDKDVKFNVFQRLNTGGVRLNAQEIRNSAFPGPLNDLILDLSVEPHFHKLLGITNKHRSAIYQEMRDAEFVLRFFTFRKTWKTFAGGMKRQMDSFMYDNKNMPEADLKELRESFLRTTRTVSAAFGRRAFARWMPEKVAWRKQVLASLFDAEMFACEPLREKDIEGKQGQIMESLKALFGDREFRLSIDAATNTPALFRNRIEAVTAAVKAAIK